MQGQAPMQDQPNAQMPLHSGHGRGKNIKERANFWPSRYGMTKWKQLSSMAKGKKTHNSVFYSFTYFFKHLFRAYSLSEKCTFGDICCLRASHAWQPVHMALVCSSRSGKILHEWSERCNCNDCRGAIAGHPSAASIELCLALSLSACSRTAAPRIAMPSLRPLVTCASLFFPVTAVPLLIFEATFWHQSEWRKSDVFLKVKRGKVCTSTCYTRTICEGIFERQQQARCTLFPLSC